MLRTIYHATVEISVSVSIFKSFHLITNYTSFFIHLVNVLGVEYFISPICMLLAEKSTNRIVRQSQEEAAVTLNLPVILLQHVPPIIRISAFVEFLKEVERLAICASNPADHPPALLDHIVYVFESHLCLTCTQNFLRDGESTVSAQAYMKRSQALVTLIHQAIQSDTFVDLDNSARKLLGSLVSGLITLASVNDTTANRFGTVSAATQKTLKKILTVMPAAGFVQTIPSMLESEDLDVCQIMYPRLMILSVFL